MIVIQVINPVYSRIFSDTQTAADQQLLLQYADYMKKWVDHAPFTPSFKAGRWDGKISFFNAATGNIMTGLVPDAYARFSKVTETALIDNLEYFTKRDIKVDPDIFIDTEFGYSLYEDQIFALEHMIKYKRAIGEIATGAGKTVMTCALLETLQPEHGLVIVPNINLVLQTYEEGFVECGLADKTGMYYGSQKDELNKYTVATWQSLQNNKEMMAEFDLVVIDESHGAKGNEIQELMMYAENAVERYGVTGTLPKPIADLTTIIGVIGPKTVEVTPADLQARNRLSNCTIFIVSFEYSKAYRSKLEKLAKAAGDKVSDTLKSNTRKRFKLRELARNKSRASAINKLVGATTGSSVILTVLQEEGKLLAENLPNSVHMHAKTKPDDRMKIKKDLQDPDDPLSNLVCTYKLGSTGLNMKTLKNIILGSPTKSFISVIQSVGRALRKHEDKTQAFIFDIDDKIKGIESANVRREFYKEKTYPVKELTIYIEDE